MEAFAASLLQQKTSCAVSNGEAQQPEK